MRSCAPFLVAALFACGPRVPAHDGYPSPTLRPWQKPQVLELDPLGEAEADDSISYAKQRRAKWYAVDLPEFGEIEVRLTYTPLLAGESEDLDVAFEVLDANYLVLTRADAEEDDAGKDRKSRTLYELPAGRYYLHVYLQGRLDEAEFSLRLAYQSGVKPHESTFPADVAFVGVLPAVPPVDDAPPPVAKPCRGAKCKKRPPPRPTTTEETGKPVRARISGITATATGTQIRIDRGASSGIAEGWRGAVITASGAAIPEGSFRVTRVTSNESYAAVKATPDAVTAAKFVRLQPP